MTDETPFDWDAAKRAHRWTEIPRSRECEPNFSLDRQLAEWRSETSPERIAELNAEWAEAIEHARKLRMGA